MNETEKTTIETELELRERLFAFKKKKQEFYHEVWRKVGIFIGVGLILLLCIAVVIFGGWEIHTIWREDVSKEITNSWFLNVPLIINGVLVFTGLGVATFLGSRFLSERE